MSFILNGANHHLNIPLCNNKRVLLQPRNINTTSVKPACCLVCKTEWSLLWHKGGHDLKSIFLVLCMLAKETKEDLLRGWLHARNHPDMGVSGYRAEDNVILQTWSFSDCHAQEDGPHMVCHRPMGKQQNLRPQVPWMDQYLREDTGQRLIVMLHFKACITTCAWACMLSTSRHSW